MTVRWVENARGGRAPRDRTPSTPDALARAAAPASGTARQATAGRDRR
ncbi:hypothetical protein [Amycolatopsis australiensis]|uniref:Uncharacterized protein n=1 Tax=Amycolatopsis australiensis TaxID=546364 RepID=A0A1K1S100_9PSEU|nr:hypothetical protein [Amycolatopsis australiensis]SFW78009.1 hypothetical protein SAMN04489730_4422 [Amycolatopsis australiensis]